MCVCVVGSDWVKPGEAWTANYYETWSNMRDFHVSMMRLMGQPTESIESVERSQSFVLMGPEHVL